MFDNTLPWHSLCLYLSQTTTLMEKRKRRRIIIGSIVGLFLAILAALILYPAIIIAKFETDLIRIANVDVAIGKENIDISTDLAVRKQTPLHALLDSISYTVSFDTFQFVKGANNFNKVRKGDEFDSINIPVTIATKTLFTALESLKGHDSTELITRFTAHYHWPIVGRVDIPMEVTMRMRPPVVPQIKLVALDVQKFSFDEPVIDVTLRLINENDFGMAIKDLSLYMDFEDLFNGDILHPGVLEIDPMDTMEMTITAKIRELKPVKALWQILVKRDTINFDMKAQMVYLDETGRFDPIDINIDTEGSMRIKKRYEENAIEPKKPKKEKRNQK